jgi:hypothetical protein
VNSDVRFDGEFSSFLSSMCIPYLAPSVGLSVTKHRRQRFQLIPEVQKYFHASHSAYHRLSGAMAKGRATAATHACGGRLRRSAWCRYQLVFFGIIHFLFHTANLMNSVLFSWSMFPFGANAILDLPVRSTTSTVRYCTEYDQKD